MFVILLICVFQLVACGCSSSPVRSGKTLSGEEAGGGAVSDTAWRFVPPDIPVALTSLEAKTGYLMEHFWDNYDFSDTVAIGNPAYAEQTLVNYLSILQENAHTADAESYLRQLADDMRQDSVVYAWFDDKLEHYLYDPNSPMRNDEYYMAILQGIMDSRNYTEMEKIRPAYRLKMLGKNRKGNKAANFKYTLEGGKKGTLYGIRSPFTLLLLYDPDCPNCRKAIDMMASSSVIRELTTVTNVEVDVPLKVLTVCVEHDRASWEEHLSLLPANWINGFDEQHMILDKELYDTRSFPSLYLMDSDKRVVLKDVNVQDVIDYFMKQND